MITPKKLTAGDKVGVVATARKISLNELKQAIEILELWNLNIVLGKFLFEEEHQFSGSMKQRADDLQQMIDDSSIKAIICARGGYGTVQIVDKIDFSLLHQNPKWIVGYSDITVLHSHLNTIGIASLHATMPINFISNTSSSLESLKNTLFGINNTISTSPQQLNRQGKVNAKIVGGNLSILYSLLGSDSDLDTSGKILFIEDLDEYLYHVDRMIINMKRNGKFDKLKGLVVGQMSDMNDNDIPFGKTAEEIISEHIKEYDFPVCFNFPSGHLNDNRAIKLGTDSKLEINGKAVVLSQ